MKQEESTHYETQSNNSRSGKGCWGFGHDGIADFKRQGAALQPSYTAASLGTARSDELRS